MNYIRHLNNFFLRTTEDKRLSPAHISLYMALFQQWNAHHFRDIFLANRKTLLKQSKIGSRATYIKCLKELDAAGYISYYPAVSKYLPPNICITRLDQPGAGPDMDEDGPGIRPGTGPDSGHLYKQTNIKQENSVLDTPMLTEVIIFFKENNYPVLEAKKFWYYNESKHWLLGDGQLIRQWEPLAHKWMLNEPVQPDKNTVTQNIHLNRDKDYGEAL